MKRLLGCLLSLLILFVLIYAKPIIAAEDEIQVLKKQVQELLRRIEQLESEQAKTNETISSQKDLLTKREELINRFEKITSSFKVNGRIAAGYFDTKKGGSFPKGSFEAPDAKVQFTFAPDEQFNVAMRANLPNASFEDLDYFWIESGILNKLIPLDLNLNSRVGKIKIDFGEETYYNNPVEGALASNSAANLSWNDEGIGFYGGVGKDIPLGWTLQVSNANSGTGSDTTTPKAFSGKIFYKGFDPLYLLVSYYNTGDLGTAKSEVKIADLQDRPSGATDWKRGIWELDLRYDFMKGKVLMPPAYSDSKAIFMASFGGFKDNAQDAPDRKGKHGLIETIYNFTDKFYGAGRYSFVDLDGSKKVAKLNGVNANKQQRYSLGLGYRLSSSTIFKFTYDWNKESHVTNADKAAEKDNNNGLAAVVGTMF